ncbi:13869_t:CDS:2 [Ambispora leptoticha]|uniref:13869_t:CDS:1 n=1 Tax=Ambispora leptoticha TaxID=144679 RepID=A0A9N9CFQ9_9GLOM|nr:13869_t:CDS:2 [Ambispora leptoticha]
MGFPIILKIYEAILNWCAPVFILAEGFATVLVVSSACRDFIRESQRRNYQIYLLIGWILGILSTGYFLVDVYLTTPNMDKISATLIGSSVTITILMQLMLFMSGKGLISETSFMFAYIVYCIYMMSYEWANDNHHQSITTKITPTPTLSSHADVSSKLQYQDLFNQLSSFSMLMDSINNIQPDIILKYITDFLCSIKFITAIKAALSLRVFTSLVFRVGVISIAITLVKKNCFGGDHDIGDYNKDDDNEFRKFLRDEDEERSLKYLTITTALSTPTIIAVYTHLLLCHYGYLDGGNYVSRWLNVFASLFFYSIELFSRESQDTDDEIFSPLYDDD